jgi:hypothetical protein
MVITNSLIWLVIIVIALTIVGTLTLIFMTRKYYWGERGTPPPSKEERQRAKEQVK